MILLRCKISNTKIEKLWLPALRASCKCDHSTKSDHPCKSMFDLTKWQINSQIITNKRKPEFAYPLRFALTLSVVQVVLHAPPPPNTVSVIEQLWHSAYRKRKIKHKNFNEEQNDFDNDHESRRIDTAVGAVLSARADDRLRRTQHHITRHIRCSACTFSNSKSNTEQTITNDSNRSWERQAVADQTAQLRRSSMASTAIRSSRTLRLFWSTSVFMIFVEYYLVIDY